MVQEKQKAATCAATGIEQSKGRRSKRAKERKETRKREISSSWTQMEENAQI
jgi:hypothetical protein